MPDDSPGGRQWIVEPPPAAAEIALYVACGEGVELTSDQEAALSALLSSLEAADVTGFAGTQDCWDCHLCTALKCGKVGCDGLICNLNKVMAGSTSGWNLMGSFSPGV